MALGPPEDPVPTSTGLRPFLAVHRQGCAWYRTPPALRSPESGPWLEAAPGQAAAAECLRGAGGSPSASVELLWKLGLHKPIFGGQEGSRGEGNINSQQLL